MCWASSRMGLLGRSSVSRYSNGNDKCCHSVGSPTAARTKNSHRTRSEFSGHGRFLEADNADKQLPPRPWPIDEPKAEFITLIGSVLNAAVDELRISKAGRYPKPFPMLPKRKLEKDEDTLWMMRFEGSENSEP